MDKNPEKSKDAIIIVRLTLEEREAFQRLSEALLGRRSVSRMLRKLVRESLQLGPDLIEGERKDFQESLRQLTGIARNLNQITAAINAGKVQKMDRITTNYIQQLLKSVDNLKNSLKGFINNTKKRGMQPVEMP